MDLDDLAPKKTTPVPLRQEDLERLSIEEIDRHVQLLTAEIERCRAAKLVKQSTLAAAQGFFKK